MPPVDAAAISASTAADLTPAQDKQLTSLVIGLLRPYRGWLLIVFIAMLVEIAMSLAAPWPLKLVSTTRSDTTSRPMARLGTRLRL